MRAAVQPLAGQLAHRRIVGRVHHLQGRHPVARVVDVKDVSLQETSDGV
jgi:hypothetical protein